MSKKILCVPAAKHLQRDSAVILYFLYLISEFVHVRNERDARCFRDRPRTTQMQDQIARIIRCSLLSCPLGKKCFHLFTYSRFMAACSVCGHQSRDRAGKGCVLCCFEIYSVPAFAAAVRNQTLRKIMAFLFVNGSTGGS